MKARAFVKGPAEDLPIGEVMWFLVNRVGAGGRGLRHHAFEVVDGVLEPLSVCGGAELDEPSTEDEPWRGLDLPPLLCKRCSDHFAPCPVECSHPEHDGGASRATRRRPELEPVYSATLTGTPETAAAEARALEEFHEAAPVFVSEAECVHAWREVEGGSASGICLACGAVRRDA